MDVGTTLSVIQTLLAALQCSQLNEAWSLWGYKSELDELSSVVATVKKVLLDAEARYDQLSQETLLYIEELRDALYDADDLLDEFVTLAKQKELMEGHKFIKKVRLFFSRYNKLGVTKLYNLHTLNLNYCPRLKELPNDLSKLVNLMVLKLNGCGSLAFMPSGMGNLTDLYNLSKFVVGERQQYAALEELKALRKLRGAIDIEIHFPKIGAFVKVDTIREGAYMRDKQHLNKIRFECKHEERNEGPIDDYEEELLGSLQPHANLKELELVGYHGVRMPAWAKENNLATFLPNLIRLDLSYCAELRCLPSLGKLCHLKYLALRNLRNLEYVECQPTVVVLGRSISEGLQFPRVAILEELILVNLPKLKEWCRRSGEKVGGDADINSSNESYQSSLFLSQLKSSMLSILECPELTSLPDCSNMENLDLRNFNERLQVITNPTSCPKLREVRIDNPVWLQYSLPIESLKSLSSLTLENDEKVEFG